MHYYKESDGTSTIKVNIDYTVVPYYIYKNGKITKSLYFYYTNILVITIELLCMYISTVILPRNSCIILEY